MILKDIAEEVNVDISTISRVSNSKYVQTPYGIIPLKQLFSESIGDGKTSSLEIKELIRELIANEDPQRPYQDDEIQKILTEQGYSIARRTVSKYRKQMNIPVSRLRIKL
jgi:RNA polymerase sigma-54 factor